MEEEYGREGYFDKEQNKEKNRTRTEESEQKMYGWMDGWMDGWMVRGVPDGGEVLCNVPSGRFHLHKVNTGKPKHWLLCFNFLLVLRFQAVYSWPAMCDCPQLEAICKQQT